MSAALLGGCAREVALTINEPPPATDETTAPLGGPEPIGTVAELRERVAAETFVYLSTDQAWLVAYPPELVEQAKAVYPDAMHAGLEAGLLALHRKCPHLGCRVPECVTSDQFECPCHGSMYSRWGEYRGGPAPHGMNLRAVVIDGEEVTLGEWIEGLPRDVDISGAVPAGPSCVDDPDPG